jgi:hypothetical protein
MPPFSQDPQTSEETASGTPWRLLLGLLVLCLVPRALMAWKIGGICPDAVLYIRMAESLERGDVSGGLQAIRFNVFPVVLMLLHGLGVPWEVAGTWWGVAISSCTVLPLWGWIRRQFGERVALTACFLYAVHPGLIRWSPEIIRDPTFWFLFTLGLYLLWRAVLEPRVPAAVAAGAALALAVMTRVEGALLLVPLTLWSFGRGWDRPELRRRLVLGGLLCVGVYPLLVGILSGLWFHSQAPWQLVRTEPLELARDWVRPAGTAAPRLVAELRPGTGSGPLSLAAMIEQFAAAAFRGITPVFLVGSVSGLAGAWRLWRRLDRQVLILSILPLGAAIWIHLCWGHETCPRYFFPVAILMSPCAATGLNRLCQGLAALLRRREAPAPLSRPTCGRCPERDRMPGPLSLWERVRVRARGYARRGSATPPHPRVGHRARLGRGCLSRRERGAIIAAAAPLVLVAAIGWAVSLGSDYRQRGAAAELGRWAGRELGPGPLTVGPDGVTQVVNYYAQGRCESFPARIPDTSLTARVQILQPDLVLLPADRKTPEDCAPLVERIERLGFAAVDRSAFGSGCEKLLVLRRE